MKEIVVITGGSSGIGMACARLLGKRYPVFIGARRPETLQQACQELEAEGIEVDCAQLDVRNSESIADFAEKAQAAGIIAHVVHCSGIGPEGHSAEDVIDTNVFGTMGVDEAFYKRIATGGCLVNITSNSGYMVSREENVELFESCMEDGFRERLLDACFSDNNMAYLLGKCFCAYYTQKNIERCMARGVRVNSIAPGPIDTPLLAQLNDVVREVTIESIPVGRAGQPEEIAKMCEFVIDNPFICGSDLLIDGGAVMIGQVEQLV